MIGQTRLSDLREQARQMEARGKSSSMIKTAFQKNPPPSGIEYSRNFVRFHKDGQFAIQTKD